MSTAIKERPILFSGPMVRAILDGRKTQTRRVASKLVDHPERDLWRYVYRTGLKSTISVSFLDELHGLCPYGQPGDRLWVRESWRLRGKHTDSATPFEVAANGSHYSLWYESDCRRPDGSEAFNLDDFGRCRSPIHMPRWASRLTLEVLSVRVEQLQEISLDDIRSEGVVDSRGKFARLSAAPTLQTQWATGWDTINGKRAPWASNPFVWVVEFRRQP